MEPADYLNWINVPAWTPYQLVFLLKGYEPVPLSDISDSSIRKDMKRELEKWKAWGTDCPDTGDWDQMYPKPFFLNMPVRNQVLVEWASNKKGVVIPEQLVHPMIGGHADKKRDKPVDKRELVTYWQILAVLCKHSNLDIEKPYEAAAIIQKWGAVHKVTLPAKKDTIADKLTAVNDYLKSL